MKKSLIFLILLSLVIPPFTNAFMECLRENPPQNIPCYIIAEKTTSCITPIFFYNITGDLIFSDTWTDAPNFCRYLFNLSLNNSFYAYNSTVADGIINIAEFNMFPIAILILIPIIFIAILVYAVSKLSDVHNNLKLAIFLLIPLFLFLSFHFGVLTLIKYYNFPELVELIGSTTEWAGYFWIFLVSYFLIWFMLVLFLWLKNRKKDRLSG